VNIIEIMENNIIMCEIVEKAIRQRNWKQ